MANAEAKSLEKIAWRFVIIDEAHRIKNDQSSLSQVVRLFRANHRLLITGTPLQNNLRELWAMLNFLLPDVFSDADAFDEWLSADSSDGGEGSVVGQLHTLLKPVLLRRLNAAGLDCAYCLLHAAPLHLKHATKVVLGADALFSNGAVLAAAGTAGVVGAVDEADGTAGGCWNPFPVPIPFPFPFPLLFTFPCW